MITQEQIEKHCKQNKSTYSKPLFATLDRDYRMVHENYTVPAGTIVEVYLTTLTGTGMLRVNERYADLYFPYDAATLLETDE